MLSFVKFPHVDRHRGETEYELALLGDFLEISEAAVEAAGRRAKLEFDQAFSELKEQTELELFAFRALDLAGRYREEMPLKVRYAFVQQLFTIAESRGTALCREIAERRGDLPVALDDLSGAPYLHGILLFLRKLVGLTVPQEAPLRALKAFRNCITHAHGKIESDEPPAALRKAIAVTAGVSIDENGYLHLTGDYCKAALATVAAFFEFVFEAEKFGAGYGCAPRNCVRHGISVEERNGRMVVEIIGPEETASLKQTKL